MGYEKSICKEPYHRFMYLLGNRSDSYKDKQIIDMIILKEKASKIIGEDFDSFVIRTFMQFSMYALKGKSISEDEINIENDTSFYEINCFIENLFSEDDEYKLLFVENYKEYLKTEHWKKIREARIFLDDNECQICGSGEELQVHHIDYIEPNMIENLVTLCKKCHSSLHESWIMSNELLRENRPKGYKQKAEVLKECIYNTIVDNDLSKDTKFIIDFIYAFAKYNPYGSIYNRFLLDYTFFNDIAYSIRDMIRICE